MDFFRDAKVVRLKMKHPMMTENGPFLTACADKNSVEIKTQSRASKQTQWTLEYPVEHSSKSKVFRLKSCFGKYLALVEQQSNGCYGSETKWKAVQSNHSPNSKDVHYNWYTKTSSSKSSKVVLVTLHTKYGKHFYLTLKDSEVYLESKRVEVSPGKISYTRENELHWYVEIVEASDRLCRSKGEDGENKVSEREEVKDCQSVVHCDKAVSNALGSVSAVISQLPPPQQNHGMMVSSGHSGGNINYSGKQINGDVIYKVNNGHTLAFQVTNNYYGNSPSSVLRK